MREELFENPVQVRSTAPAPHFEDRRVIMRAQPVVPLDEIRSKLRFRRMWFLSSAFAVAMLLGAASALVAVRVKRIAANTEIPQIEEPETTVTAAAQAPPVQMEPISDSTIVEEMPVPQPPRAAITTPKRQEPLAQRPRVVGRDREALNGRAGVQPSEDEQLEQIREAVLYEQWQERRARRAARRERRRGDRDLSRVDEIFSGPRHPERP